MKPYIEHVGQQEQFTWRLGNYTGGYGGFEWHYHWVFELVLHRNHKGKLFAGAYTGDLNHDSLALFGPRLPHTNILEPRNQSSPTLTRCLWFSPAWIDAIVDTLPEYQPIATLLQTSQRGLVFDDAMVEMMSNRLDDFEQLSQMRQSARILDILVELAERGPTKVLNPTMKLTHDLHPEHGEDKLDRLMRYIDTHYQQDVDLDQLANHLHISRSSVQRLFKKHFLESFSEHLAQYRIGKACEKLLNTEQAVAVISDSVGYTNLSNFNRQFRKIKGMTPSEFRQVFRRQ